MSSEYFIRCFRRFSARRGLPSRIISDNAKTFKSTAKVLKEIMNHPDVHRYLENARVEWKFNVEKAPWWGGVFERLIRSVKRCLRKIIGRAKLSLEELSTIVIEVEMVVNSRPLTYVSLTDLEELVTPSHLLIGRRLLSLPESLLYDESEDEDYNATPQLLSNRMKYLNKIMDHFWKRWKSEYLLELREAHRFGPQGVKGESVAVGDVVVIHNDDKKRGFWNFGMVEELIMGRDDEVRGAVIRVSNKNKSKLLRRPVQRLYPLEVKDPKPDGKDKETVESSPQTRELEDRVVENRVIEEPRRSRRVAAARARDQILAQSIN